MKMLAVAMVLAVMAGAPSYSHACDPAQPKCAAVNKLLDRLGYREKLLEGQRLCEANAAHLSPVELHKKGVTRLIQLKKDGPGWSEAEEAHGRFVSAVCGAEEIVQVLQNFYRNEWLAVGTEQELIQLAGKEEPISGALIKKVNAAAGAKAAALLDRMHKKGLEEYESEVKTLAARGTGAGSGVAQLCPNGELDERTQTCKSKR